jgi:hypothetical protein
MEVKTKQLILEFNRTIAALASLCIRMLKSQRCFETQRPERLRTGVVEQTSPD